MTGAGVGALLALILFIVASVWLGTVAHRAMQKGSFLKGYFLGNRGLGAWAVALTATVQSGGTFMGFPSLVYSYGWVVALWIASYMVVPITAFGVLGKRLAQLSRRTGAITVPDLFRERFGSPAVGLVASLFILLFMSVMMVPQFKAGATVMKVAWPGSGTLALSEGATAHQLDERAFQTLKDEVVPDEVLAKLQPLKDVRFKTAKELEDKLGQVLSAEELQAYKTRIVKQAEPIDWRYLLGLAIFTLTVVGYTLIGGFLAAVWTDLFQSILMFVGVVLLLVLALVAAGGLEAATVDAAQRTGPGFVYGPGYSADKADKDWEFLPLGLGFSFFFLWIFSGLGSPSGVVRVMACKNTQVLRRSIFLLSWYNILIYLPLIVICVCGRALIPDLPPRESDDIIPRLAFKTTEDIPGGSLIAGLILAAPFGAVMATVSSYLVVIASGLVRDVYQRFIHPDAPPRLLRLLAYGCMIAVGALAVLANLNPVTYLQAVVVFSGTSGASTLAIPLLMVAFWRRATAAGAIAGMVAGAATTLTLYAAGWLGFSQNIGEATSFRPYYLLEMHPIVWGLSASLLAGVGVSLFTKPPDAARVSWLFDAQPEPKGGTH